MTLNTIFLNGCEKLSFSFEKVPCHCQYSAGQDSFFSVAYEVTCIVFKI